MEAPRVTDSQGREIGYLPFDLRAGTQSPLLTVQVRPKGANSVFQATSSPWARILARRAGTADPFVDLAAGIDLSGETPDLPLDFEVKGEADSSVVGQVRVAIWFGVVTSSGASGAGWTV